MLDKFIAIVLYETRPSLSAPGLETAVRELEPGGAVTVEAGAADDSLLLKIDHMLVTVTARAGQMPEEAAVTSLGMADLNENDMQRVMNHGAHVMLECSEEGHPEPMEKMIALVRTGMALCNNGAMAMCLPASGLCLLSEQLQRISELDNRGPRVWGVDDEAEVELAGYEKYTLWESLRQQAQPAFLLVGFVPAEVDGQTWFFSAGHSLFGMPEIAYADGNLEEFHTIRGLFRFIFANLYQQHGGAEPGRIMKTNDPALSIALEKLHPNYAELESPTGTLLVRLITKGLFSDWESA